MAGTLLIRSGMESPAFRLFSLGEAAKPIAEPAKPKADMNAKAVAYCETGVSIRMTVWLSTK
jgi:hypothetical protein